MQNATLACPHQGDEVEILKKAILLQFWSLAGE